MITRPAHVNPCEFAVVCALRAHQLLAGCTPRVEGDHRATTMAQMEVVAGRVMRTVDDSTTTPPRGGPQR